MLKVRFEGTFSQSQYPARDASSWVEVSRGQCRSADVVIWHALLWEDLPDILIGSPNARIVSVTNGGATFSSVQSELAKDSYSEDDRRRVFGATVGDSISVTVQLWPDLVRYFSGGGPTTDVNNFLGLEQPVRLMALSAALQVAGRELRRQSPRIQRTKLLDPALKLASQCGRDDIRGHIAQAIADERKAASEVECALRALQGKAVDAGD